MLAGRKKTPDFQAWCITEDEERIGNKLYYRKRKYITSNNENFKVYVQ